jgi:hypothetical protein
MGRPNQTHDRLDALLDGRPGEVTDDLAPLLAAAEALRVELAEFELDPEVVDRHLEQALDRPATVVPLPVREGRGGLRRRLVAVGLAAALVLVPATAASAASGSSLPGQPLYPVKLAFEQFRLAAVQWSATAEAHERTRLAAIRLKELDKLVKLGMFHQVPPAIHRLDRAMEAAQAAVVEAVKETGESGEGTELLNNLGKVQVAKADKLVELLRTIVKFLPTTVLPLASRQAIESAVRQSQAITPPPSSPTPAAATVAPQTTGSQPEPSAPATTQPEPTTPPPTEPEPVTTPTSTDAPTTTTPPPTEPPTTVDSGGSPAGAGFDATPTSSTGP